MRRLVGQRAKNGQGIADVDHAFVAAFLSVNSVRGNPPRIAGLAG
jgi:hypothetical protein